MVARDGIEPPTPAFSGQIYTCLIQAYLLRLGVQGMVTGVRCDRPLQLLEAPSHVGALLKI